MSEKRPKGKRKKAETAGVLGSLPSTRPSRMVRSRDAVTPASPPAARPKAKARPKAAAKPRAAARPKAAAPKRRAPAKAAGGTDGPGPRPVTAGARDLQESARVPEPSTGQSGTELVTTVVQAGGELARIGLTVGGQILKRAVDRIPRP